MTIRALFLCEGTSDEGIATHIDRIAADHGLDALTTTPDLSRLAPSVGKSVAAKLQAIVDLHGEYDLVAIHRDADNAGADARYQEIEDAARAVSLAAPLAAVVPVRMTEAWLVLDEDLIRRVAGNPSGRAPLGLPSPHEVERRADPKTLLREALTTASELRGRRLSIFRARFSEHRHQILEQLDPTGPVTRLASWRRFVDDMTEALLQAQRATR